jgi:DNA-binding GntR family transcriptional regulator
MRIGRKFRPATREIIKAVKKKDEILAGSLMRKHLESSRRALYG